jgi:hypothetical protein
LHILDLKLLEVFCTYLVVCVQMVLS